LHEIESMQLTPEQKKGIASFAGVSTDDKNLVKVFDYYESFVPDNTEITLENFHHILTVMIQEAMSRAVGNNANVSQEARTFVGTFITLPGFIDTLLNKTEKKEIKSTLLHHLLKGYGYLSINKKPLLVYVVEKLPNSDLRKEIKETISSYLDQHERQFKFNNKQDEFLEYLASIYQSDVIDLEILRQKFNSNENPTEKSAALIGLICRSDNIEELKKIIQNKKYFAFLEKNSIYIEKTIKSEQKVLLHFLLMRHCAELPGKGKLALNFAYSANTTIKDEKAIREIYGKVIKKYPWTPDSYIRLIRYMEESDNKEEKEICEKMIQRFPAVELSISKQDEIIRDLQKFSESNKISKDFFISFAETIYKNFDKSELGKLLKEDFSKRSNAAFISPIHRRAMFRAMLSKVDSADEIFTIYNSLFPAYLARTAIISDLNYFAFSASEPRAFYANIVLAKFMIDQKRYENATLHLLKVKDRKGISLLAGNNEFNDFVINKIAPVRSISTARRNRKRSKEESSSLQLSSLPEDEGKSTLAELMFLIPASKEQLSKIPVKTILKVFEITHDKLFVAKQIVKNGLLTSVANQDPQVAQNVYSILTSEEERKDAVYMLLSSPYYVALNSKKLDKFEDYINVLGVEKSCEFYEKSLDKVLLEPLARALVNKFYDKLIDSQRLLFKDFLSPVQLHKLGVRDEIITKELLSQLYFDQAYEIFKNSNDEPQKRKAAKQILSADSFIEKATEDQIVELCKSYVIAAGEAKFVLDRINALKGNGRIKLILGFSKSEAINHHAMENDVFKNATLFQKKEFYRKWFINLSLSGSDLNEIIKSSEDQNILAAIKSDDGLMKILLPFFIKMDIKEIAQNDLTFKFIIEYLESKNADFFTDSAHILDKLLEFKPLTEIKVSNATLQSKLVCAATKYKKDDKEARVALCLQNLNHLNGAVTDVLNSYKPLIQSGEPADQKLVFPLVSAIFSSSSLKLEKIDKNLLFSIVDNCITKPQDINSTQILDRIITYAYSKGADATLIAAINERIDANWRGQYLELITNNAKLSSDTSQNFGTAVQIGAILQGPESVVKIGYVKFCELLVLYEKISKLLKFDQYQTLVKQGKEESAEKIKKYQVSGAIHKGILLNLQKNIDDNPNEAASEILDKYKAEKLEKDDNSSLSNLFYEWLVGSEQGDIQIQDSIIKNILSSLLSKESAFKTDLKIPISFPAEGSIIYANRKKVGVFKGGIVELTEEIGMGTELYSDDQEKNYLGTYVSTSGEIDPEILVSANNAESFLLHSPTFSKMNASRKASLFKRICQQKHLPKFLEAAGNKKEVMNGFVEFLKDYSLLEASDWDAVVKAFDKESIKKVFDAYLPMFFLGGNLPAARALIFALLRDEEKFTAFGVANIFDMFEKAKLEIVQIEKILKDTDVKSSSTKNFLLAFLLCKQEYVDKLYGSSKDASQEGVELGALNKPGFDKAVQDLQLKALPRALIEKLDERVKERLVSLALDSQDIERINSLLAVHVQKVFPKEMILAGIFKSNDRMLNALQVGHPLCHEILSNLEYHDHVRAAITHAAQKNNFNIFYRPIQQQLRTDVLSAYIPQFINEWLKYHKKPSADFNQFVGGWKNAQLSSAVKSLLSFANTADDAGKMMVADQLFANVECIKYIKEQEKKYRKSAKMITSGKKSPEAINKLREDQKKIKAEILLPLHAVMKTIGSNEKYSEKVKNWFKALGHKVEGKISTVNKLQLKAVHNLSKIFKFHHRALTAKQKTISKDAKREADLQLNEIYPKGNVIVIGWNKFLNLLRTWAGRDYVADQVEVPVPTSKNIEKPTVAQPSIQNPGSNKPDKGLAYFEKPVSAARVESLAKNNESVGPRLKNNQPY